jgi:cytochrome b subunit of formate dehydrogenase
MMATMRIRRFSRLDRMFHLGLMLTFLIQTATGFGRLFYGTAWGKLISGVFGGYETALKIHQSVGSIMIVGFILHIMYLMTRVEWANLGKSVFGPDSLVPTLQDARHLGARIKWFFGLGAPPKLDRWAYWEKFDYWAVFWGLPLLAVTGVMLMYPLQTSRFLPGWALNVAGLLHEAEAILAVGYIFIVHFFIGHLRPFSFPLNEAMFAGSVAIEEAMEEKPAWVERIKQEGGLEVAAASPPAAWYRIVYFVFGYAAVAFGIYLLISAITYSRYIKVH